ncbi:hypothetical protein [Caulobacter endophyticus]|uniref:hypothetical protein n=1 Tax=Caulobacter endophyticus TaxID=2172652 RepID=UPI0011B2463C|nr:hypothetical protein [Caulobacter endophyticus]
MTHGPIDEPLTAELLEGEVVVTEPNGFNGSLTMDAARRSAENLLRAVEQAESGQDVYQKPLG